MTRHWITKTSLHMLVAGASFGSGWICVVLIGCCLGILGASPFVQWEPAETGLPKIATEYAARRVGWRVELGVWTDKKFAGEIWHDKLKGWRWTVGSDAEHDRTLFYDKDVSPQSTTWRFGSHQPAVDDATERFRHDVVSVPIVLLIFIFAALPLLRLWRRMRASEKGWREQIADWFSKRRALRAAVQFAVVALSGAAVISLVCMAASWHTDVFCRWIGPASDGNRSKSIYEARVVSGRLELGRTLDTWNAAVADKGFWGGPSFTVGTGAGLDSLHSIFGMRGMSPDLTWGFGNQAEESSGRSNFAKLGWVDTKETQRVVSLPFTTVIVVLAIVPVVFLRRVRRQRSRAINGLCAKCGYDVRATPQRCPECGEQIGSSSTM